MTPISRDVFVKHFKNLRNGSEWAMKLAEVLGNGRGGAETYVDYILNDYTDLFLEFIGLGNIDGNQVAEQWIDNELFNVLYHKYYDDEEAEAIADMYQSYCQLMYSFV
jgi:hypothetical protein